MSTGDFLFIYTNVFLIKGFTRTMVLDLSKTSWVFFDNDYAELIDLFKTDSISNIRKNIDPESIGDFDNFVTFLINNDYAAYVDDLSLFPKIEEVWYSPYKISNSIIDFNDKIHDMKKISEELFLLGCQYIELRFYSKIEIDKIKEILDCFRDKDFRSIHLIIKYNEKLTNDLLFSVCASHLNISFTVYNSPVNEYFKNELDNVLPSMGCINYIQQNIIDCRSCGVINSTIFFNPKNVGLFMGNKLYNSCLNRKISIDTEGYIKNCPSMKNSFGNIEDKSLLKVYEEDAFKDIWNLNKDQIETCKDCEFRYVCSDCRAYTENPDNAFSKPLKCGYNPYTGEWHEWSLNPLNQKAIKHYRMEDFVIS